MHTVSGSISLPSQGFFSPFPHGTGSLSVSQEYLALEDGPPIFRQDITCPALLVFTDDDASVTGLSPFVAPLSRGFTYIINSLRANPISLAATFGISVDFSSSGYLDVSVPPVCLLLLCIHNRILTYVSGFPHSGIPDSKGYYYLIWAYRKLLRLSSPLTAKASTVYA